MSTPRQRKIIREIRRLHARRLPLNLSAVKRSHPKLVEQVYAMRPFWGWKRALEDAGLSYSMINVELLDYVTCEICGEDFAILPNHLISRHEVSAEDYRDEFPEAEIVCETIRAEMSRRQLRRLPALAHWESIWSAEYVLDRIAELHRLGFPMTSSWARKPEGALATNAAEHFGSGYKALQRIGLDPEQIRLSGTGRFRSKWWHADEEAICAEIRRRKSAGETLLVDEIGKEKFGQSLMKRGRNLFGSWPAAIMAAGLEPPRRKTPWPRANKVAILAEIRRRQTTGESVRYGRIHREKGGAPLVRRAAHLFGSWTEALVAAEIDLPKGSRSPWPTANKAAVLAEIRRRHRAGQSLQTTIFTRGKQGHPLLNRAQTLFGSWTAALLEARLDLPIRARSPWWGAGKADILAEIRRRKRAGEPLRMVRISQEKWGDRFVHSAKKLFGSWDGALIAAGLEPLEPINSPWPQADRAAILAELRRRERSGEALRTNQVTSEKWGHALVTRTAALFGSWTAALLQAGVDPPIGTWSPWPDASEKEILAEIRRRKEAGESIRYGTIERQQWGAGFLTRAKHLFGSWNAAILAAGVALPNSPWPKADRAAILSEIRRRKRASESLRFTEVLKEKWGRSLLRRSTALCGSWKDALREAGVPLASNLKERPGNAKGRKGIKLQFGRNTRFLITRAWLFPTK